MPWAEHDQLSPVPQPPPRFHPEFGYVAPVPYTRRLVRVGLIAGLCGIALGAIAAVALTSAPTSVAGRTERVLTVGHAVATGQTSAVIPATAVPEPAAAAQRQCKEQTWPYIDRTCRNDTSPKSPPARVVAPGTSVQDAPTAARQAATSDANELKPADEPQPPAASPPAPEKTAHVRKKKRSRSRQEEVRSAYASPYGERYDSGARYNYGMRYDYGANYPQQRGGGRGGWSW